jgi:hypothetical protein
MTLLIMIINFYCYVTVNRFIVFDVCYYHPSIVRQAMVLITSEHSIQRYLFPDRHNQLNMLTVRTLSVVHISSRPTIV